MTEALRGFIADLGSIPHTTDAATIRRKSRDHFVISPILRSELARKLADVVASPRSKAELVAVVAAAVKRRLPITPRGGGTANYGQSVPLNGGVVLDCCDFGGVLSIEDGVIRANAGANMAEMQKAARARGWELRIHPSTIAQSTIAGFVAGGSGGVGSAMWGMLRDRGNILAIEAVSAEPEPRVVELVGDDVELVHHAYGANAVITEIAMPLAPTLRWRECVVAFPRFQDAAAFGARLVRETGVLKKVSSVHEWPIASLVPGFAGLVPEGHSMALSIVAHQCFESFRSLVAEFRGAIVWDGVEGEDRLGAPLHEFVYGHGLRQMQKAEPRYTGIQGMFRGPSMLDMLERARGRAVGQPFRLEFFWSEGEVVAMGSPQIVFESDAQMRALVDVVQASGGAVANSHAASVTEVGIKRLTPRDVVFKREMDPFNLLNPGKLDLEKVRRADLGAAGWSFRDR